MVPEGWSLTSLREVCSGNLQTGPFGSQLHAHEYVSIGIPVLMPKDLIDFRADLVGAAKISQEKAGSLGKHVLKAGDLLFSRRGDVSRFALIDSDSEGALCGTGCLKARPNSRHSSKFLAYFIQKESVRKWLEQNAVGQTMPNMNTEILGELPLIVASSREEEEKIAQILSTWDKAITTTEQLLANSQRQKKALMQQLLTGKKRLLDKDGVRFSGEWKKIAIGKIIKEVKYEKEENPSEIELLTVKLHYKGVVRTGKFPNATERGRPYFRRNAGELIIGRQNLHNGGVAIVPKECDGLIASNAISSFEARDGYDIGFVLSIMSTDHFRFTVDNLAGGTGQKEIGVKDLLSLCVFAPEFEEQKIIAAILTTSKQEITALQQCLDALKQEKKALMQELLTGKRRVRISEGD